MKCGLFRLVKVCIHFCEKLANFCFPLIDFVVADDNSVLCVVCNDSFEVAGVPGIDVTLPNLACGECSLVCGIKDNTGTERNLASTIQLS